MKLLIAIIQEQDMDKLSKVLAKANIFATLLQSQGTFLKQKNITVLMAFEENNIDNVLKIFKKCCVAKKELLSAPPVSSLPGEFITPGPTEITVGGATIMILDINKFEKI